MRIEASLIEARKLSSLLFVSGGDSSEVLEFIEEPFDSVALAVEPGGEGGAVLAARHRADIAPGAASFEVSAQRITVIGAIGKEDVPGLDGVEQAGGGGSVVACPSVSFIAIGRPSASTSAWIFVVKPPRERPMQRDPSVFLTVGGVLMNPDRR